MIRFLRNLLLCTFVALFLLPLSVSASHIPAPTSYVNDFANVLTTEQKTLLENQLSEYEKQSGNEIAVAIIKSLNGGDINDFAVRTFEEWKIGKKNKDNGLLLLIAIEERELRIEVGYGLEPELTDGEAGDIIRDVIAPALKDGDYYAGIANGVSEITKKLAGTTNREVDDEPPSLIDRGLNFFYLIILLFIYIPAYLARSKDIYAGGVIGLIMGFWIAYVYMGLFVGVVSGVVFGALGILLDWWLTRNYEQLKKSGKQTDWWHTGGGFYGGRRGGGFGGFGGGSSGGGGASGRW